jgi:hypothetical protein
LVIARGDSFQAGKATFLADKEKSRRSGVARLGRGLAIGGVLADGL